ncbi:unnamed protein product [Cylindrotheca closterium]|uniref:UBC core domain-containing protein n=1 Tax=Cylindrotheca closterium TaxID=2856 RepID=A0AAD2FLK9_9STRA|nr:unnamed protein product [Cylindrotheca closterium]
MSKSPSLRRIQADIRELALDPSDRYYAHPLEHDMFEWHFTIRGADDTDFEGGIYHGRILLPPEYPFKPPHILFMTPSGRFETHKKICLSFSAYHPELWQPAWGVRLILEALISFMPTPADGAVGALDWSSEERKRLAKKSREFCCPGCGKIEALLPKLDPHKKQKANRFSKEIEKLQQLQQLSDKKKEDEEGEDKKDAKESSGDSKASDNPKASLLTTATSTSASDDQKPAAAPSPKSSAAAVPSLEQSNVTASNATATSVHVETATGDENTTETIGLLDGDDGSRDPGARVTTAGIAQENVPDVTGRVNEEAAAGAAVVEESNLSWVYDPILNLMIVLLAAVCWLLWQKFVDLRQELATLREQNLLWE